MRRLLPGLLLFSLACNTLLPAGPPPTFTPAPTVTPAPRPAATATAILTATPAPAAPAARRLRPEDLTFHPDPQLYSGDIVSLEINAAGADPAWRDVVVRLYVGGLTGQPIAESEFGAFGIGERAQATFWWAWDTTGLAGPQTLAVSVEPKGSSPLTAPPLDSLHVSVNLLPADQRPAPEPLAKWAVAESACCIFHYLTHTAAARDLESITQAADAAFDRAEAALGVERGRKVSFTLLSRLLGHGGFATSEIYLTYIDRNPAGLDLPTVFIHEGVHILDQEIARVRPAIMTEGLAVFVAGGHYQVEDIERRAAALLQLGGYIPLASLARAFYPAQHEAGYLEAASLVKYMIDQYGWPRFRDFYGSFKMADDEAQMLEAALIASYGKSLAEIESEWLEHLRALEPGQAEVEHLRLTIALFDTLRRYQQLNDPSAYFLSAWLPDGPAAREQGITADFVRHPRAPENIALEAMLADAGRALEAADFERAERLIAAVNAVLAARNLFLDPLAADYLRVVVELAAQGYEAQAIRLDGPTATVTAIRDWPVLETLTLVEAATGWRVTRPAGANGVRPDCGPGTSRGGHSSVPRRAGIIGALPMLRATAAGRRAQAGSIVNTTCTSLF